MSKLHKILNSCQKEILGLKDVVKNAENTISDLNKMFIKEKRENIKLKSTIMR